MNYFKCLSSGYIPYPFTCSTGNRNIKSIFEFTSYFFLKYENSILSNCISYRNIPVSITSKFYLFTSRL